MGVDFNSPEVARLIQLLSINKSKTSDSQNPTTTSTVLEEDFEGDNSDHFDLAIQQFRDLRARASQLPDEQRKNMAAQMAMAFMQLMGDDDDDDDDKEDLEGGDLNDD